MVDLPGSTGGWSGELPDDAAGTCDALAAAHVELTTVETRRILLAAHWLDLHAPPDEPDTHGPQGPGRALPGQERYVRSGADGTPMVAEFACAEFAAVQEMHPLAGRAELRKVANLRYRHPALWARVVKCEVPGWKALETSRLVGRAELGLTKEQAHWIDAHSFEWITTLPWSQYLQLLERLIIDADPDAAESRRHQAETRTGVWTGQTDEHGLKTLIARANAGEVIYLTAVVDRLAEILALKGDPRPIGNRRAAALSILAHPAHALTLLAEYATAPAGDGTDVCDPDPLDEPQPEPEPVSEPDGLPSYLDVPPALRRVLDRLHRLGGPGLARLLPPATLYLHLDSCTLQARTQTGTGSGSVHVEDIGVVTLGQAAEWLGHRRVRVTPVLHADPTQHPAVDGYVFPRRLREAAHLHNPRDVFPYGVNTSRHKDFDHVVPYQPPDHGGPPGQTGLHNAAPMTRFHHRLKTFGHWHLMQLGPGAHLWHSPHHHCYLVDATGTHKIPSAALPWILAGIHTGQDTGKDTGTAQADAA